MHFSLVSSVLLASQAVAIVPRSPFAHLFARQTTDACTASCSTFDDALNACTTTGCLCTATVANGLNSCVNCYYSNTPTADVLTSANKLIGTYEDTCSAYTLPAISVKTSSGRGATTAVTTAVATVVSTAPRVTTTTKTPVVVTSVAAGTTVSPPKVTVTAVTGADGTTTAAASTSSSGNVIPGLTGSSGAISTQCQALVVPAAVVLGAFLALM